MDTDFARYVHHQAYRDVVERQFGPWVDEDQDKFFEEGWSSAASEIILCDGSPCGYLSIEDRENDVHVRELVLLPKYQGLGIGSSFLRDVIEHARRRYVPVRLETFHRNHAIDLYHRLGFREIGQSETQILLERSGDET